ncbi:endonuclease/exonuclease/phosphatase family protein [Inhella sp. 1Y17]|uniref:Endonuclease/exonuclease/phosphatase family protein n=1 Tax=Inhella proteolytica TaxID=2795029 RepID=A0A931J1D1_9BURK|nr:endonuclease/exonuclease/phosphatase family protein [Inhella proteolytica]
MSLVGLASPWLSRWLGVGTLAWLADLAAHWAWCWVLLGLLCLPWALVHADGRTLLGLVVLGLPWLPLPPRTPALEAAPAWSVVTANVNLDNHDPRALKAWLAVDSAAPVAVVALVEVTPRFAAAWGQDSRWPHAHWAPREDPFGLALLSRWPIESVRMEADAAGIPRLRARLRSPDGLIELWVLHPMPPLAPRWAALRDDMLASLQPGGPALALGDFNASPWSRGANQLAAQGWQQASGLGPTWPGMLGGWWGIPIDMVWTHGPWRRGRAEVGPDIGSDHRPVRVPLRLQPGG